MIDLPTTTTAPSYLIFDCMLQYQQCWRIEDSQLHLNGHFWYDS